MAIAKRNKKRTIFSQAHVLTLYAHKVTLLTHCDILMP